MKRFSLMLTLVGLFALGAYQVRAMPPQDNSQDSAGTKAKNDAKEAGHAPKTPRRKPAAP